jgi:hypothetical protein
MATNTDATASALVSYWKDELGRAKKRYQTFWENGDAVVDAYRLQKADGNDSNSKDKYNILYSSTETIRPNLYAQQPKARVTLRNKDLATDTARAAAMLLEGNLAYLMKEEDFDEMMDATVEDFMLPGLGTGWVRYDATFGDMKGADGKPVMQADGKTPQQELLDEMVKMEYVYWQDFLTGVCRTWKTCPWLARRIWIDKEEATARFDAQKANNLKYQTRDTTSRESNNPSETAEIWEIWNKKNKTVYWFSDDLPDFLDVKPDPLKLKNFWPCPRPLRAISNTRTFVPRALYSQYKSQADTLNIQTKRIRLLSEALRVVGVYDGSQTKLNDMLNPTSGNRMIAIDSWAMFAQSGGIDGVVQWVPIDAVVKALNELLKARDVCKQEIYEITGFSDIVRGVSKASETLGAQNIKANWAGARVKKMQAEVQRYARDMIALAGELVAEHCAPETIAMFSGLPIPEPEEVQADPELQKRVQTFKEACAFLHNEARRVSTVDIETDSTLLADDSAEREDRTKFLAAAGAFLQQAVPAMEATPAMGPLLGALLMFVVRTFPSSRPVEDEFEKVQQAMASRAQQTQDQDKDGKKAAAAADAQKNQQDAQLKAQELQVRQAHEQATAQNDATAETNRHAEKMLELRIKDREMGVREREVALKEGELAVEEQNADTAKFAALHAAAIAEMTLGQDDQQQAEQLELEYESMDRDDAHKDADREAQAASAEADRQAQASEPGDDA